MGFLAVFQKVFLALAGIFAIALCGFYLRKKNLISEAGMRDIGSLTINVFLPCMIFAHLLRHGAQASSGTGWILYPLLGIAVSFFGWGLGMVFQRAAPCLKAGNEFKSLIAFQNCGYLPLMLVAAIFPKAEADELFTLIFLFIQGFNLIFWSFGARMLGAEKSRLRRQNFINPPLAALVLGMFAAGTRFGKIIPGGIVRVTELLGACTLPVALLTVGALLAVCPKIIKGAKPFLFKTVAAKLCLMPAAALLLIRLFPMPHLTAFLILLQASMPSAINLSILSYYKNGQCDIVGQGVFLTHILSLVTIPAVIAAASLFLPLF